MKALKTILLYMFVFIEFAIMTVSAVFILVGAFRCMHAVIGCVAPAWIEVVCMVFIALLGGIVGTVFVADDMEADEDDG